MNTETMVESIIKRKGGTEVTFGHAHHKRITYHFKPEDGLANSPHVCDVKNDEHRAKLLSIKNGFRLLNQKDQLAESEDDSQEENQEAEGSYDDLLGINPDLIDATWLQAFARHLELNPKGKAEIIAYAKENWDVELNSTATATNLLREVLKLTQKDQLAESEAAKLQNT